MFSDFYGGGDEEEEKKDKKEVNKTERKPLNSK